MYERPEPSILVHMLHHTHKRQVAEAQKAHGIADMSAPVILLALFRAGEKRRMLSQRELAHMLRLSPATVAVSLQNMEKCGYVLREIDPADARRNLLSLTEKGKDAVEQCGNAFQAVDRQMLDGFTPEEREQLNGFFLRMLKNLGVSDPAKERPPFPPPGEGCCPGERPARRQRRKERDSQ